METRGAHRNLEHTQPSKYQPLAELQTVPPYGNFYNNNLVNTGQYYNPGRKYQQQSDTYLNSSSKVNNDNPNNNEIQRTPIMYNQVTPNPPMNTQTHPSFFPPSYQYQGHNYTPFFWWRGQTFLLEKMTQKKVLTIIFSQKPSECVGGMEEELFETELA